MHYELSVCCNRAAGMSLAGAMAGAPGHVERETAIPDQQSEMHCVLQQWRKRIQCARQVLDPT